VNGFWSSSLLEMCELNGLICPLSAVSWLTLGVDAVRKILFLRSIIELDRELTLTEDPLVHLFHFGGMTGA
jgi:hypothetical protein